MTVDCFLDTNVIVYAAAGAGADRPKREAAFQLLESERFGLSAQILQEFYVTVTRKIAVPLAPVVALEWIDQLAVFPNLPIDLAVVRNAAEISERFRISYWDGAVVAAAEALGASTLYSEDLNHQQVYGRVRVVNPFRDIG
jgi:predicted nucleic acid-binding protein